MDVCLVFQNGFTPLHFASRAGHLEVVCLLVETGGSPAHGTKDGKVPLNFAAANNHADVLSFLLKKEHDTHRLMDDKKVPLRLAFTFNKYHVIKCHVSRCDFSSFSI